MPPTNGPLVWICIHSLSALRENEEMKEENEAINTEKKFSGYESY
jgi:hypothetical protein